MRPSFKNSLKTRVTMSLCYYKISGGSLVTIGRNFIESRRLRNQSNGVLILLLPPTGRVTVVELL